MPNILIVEDKDSMRKMLTETLTGEGHRVEVLTVKRKDDDLETVERIGSQHVPFPIAIVRKGPDVRQASDAIERPGDSRQRRGATFPRRFFRRRLCPRGSPVHRRSSAHGSGVPPRSEAGRPGDLGPPRGRPPREPCPPVPGRSDPPVDHDASREGPREDERGKRLTEQEIRHRASIRARGGWPFALSSGPAPSGSHGRHSGRTPS